MEYRTARRQRSQQREIASCKSNGSARSWRAAPRRSDGARAATPEADADVRKRYPVRWTKSPPRNEDAFVATPPSAAAPANEPWLEVTASRQFPAWLAEHNVSLALTTYQTGKLILIGRHEGRIAVFERTFNRCMGLWADGQTLWMNSLYQLWRFENVLRPDRALQRPRPPLRPARRLHHRRPGHPRHRRRGRRPGGVRQHQVRLPGHARTNATASRRSGSHPSSASWRRGPLPPQRPGPGRRQGPLRHGGQHERRRPTAGATNAGTAAVVIDVPRQIGSSPRGCRCRTRRASTGGRLWLLNSGTGYFGSIDPTAGVFVPLTFCPGYLRGLTFVGDYAVVGLSRPRHDKTFGGLALDEDAGRPRASRRAAGCTSSTCRRATWSTGCAWKAWSANCTTWSCCRGLCGRPRWASRRTRFNASLPSVPTAFCEQSASFAGSKGAAWARRTGNEVIYLHCLL